VQANASVSDPGNADDDMLAIKATPAVKAGAAFMAGAGVLGLVLALQGAAVLGLRGIYQLTELVFGLLGALGIYAGARFSAMRGVGARLSAVVGGLLAVLGLAWFVIAFVGGVLILLALVLVPVGGVAAGFALSNLEATRRADQARSRLRAQGLDAGL
jgi:hypothetical protein